MKTQLSKPARSKASYTDQYKQEALELWRSSGRSAAKVRSLEELEAEIRRLTEENAKLLEQREVLKKSLGILSEAPPRGMPKSNK